MFQTIIIGVDGRPGGLDAICLARRLAAPSATLVVTSVAVGFERVAEAEQAVAEATSGQGGLQAEVYVAPVVAEGLHDIARMRQADLVVVGSCHRGTAGRLLLGSDAAKVLRDAPCAAAVAPHGYAPGNAVRRIGVGYDRRPESEQALAVARDVAAGTGARIEVLHVVAVNTWVTPPNVYSGSAIDGEMRSAREAVQGLPGVEGRVEIGFPADDLVAFSQDVDLLVVGTRHHSAAGRVFLGSTAESLAGRAEAPVLVVPRATEAADATLRPGDGSAAARSAAR